MAFCVLLLVRRKQDELKAALTKQRQLQAAADEAEELCRRQSEEIASLKLVCCAGICGVFFVSDPDCRRWRPAPTCRIR